MPCDVFAILTMSSTRAAWKLRSANTSHARLEQPAASAPPAIMKGPVGHRRVARPRPWARHPRHATRDMTFMSQNPGRPDTLAHPRPGKQEDASMSRHSTSVPVFEDLSVGRRAAAARRREPHAARISCATPARRGDFNPMHHDDTIATQVGNPSVFGHGMLTAGFMARVREGLLRCPRRCARFQVRFAKQVWPGETLTCTAKVTDKRTSVATRSSTSSCAVTNQDGEAKLTGTATAAVVPEPTEAGTMGTARRTGGGRHRVGARHRT